VEEEKVGNDGVSGRGEKSKRTSLMGNSTLVGGPSGGGEECYLT
jgi:hypothetical protein